MAGWKLLPVLSTNFLYRTYRLPTTTSPVVLILVISVTLTITLSSAQLSPTYCDNNDRLGEPPAIQIHFASTSSSSSSSSSTPLLELDEDELPSSLESEDESGNVLPWSELIFQGCKVHVKFLCSAKYPIEWVENYDQDIDQLADTDGQIHKNMWTDRVIKATGNSSTHLASITGSDTSYDALLGLTYLSNSSFCFAANYSCRSVSNPCLQSGIVASVDPDNQTIQYHLSNSSIISAELEQNESSPCDAIITVSVKHGYSAWMCTDKDSKYLIPFTKSCDGAMHCNSFFQHYKKNCVKRLPPDEDCYGCRYKNAKKARFHPGYIWCGGDDGGEVLTALPYFYSVPQTMNKEAIPELYLGWDEADPQEMLYLEPLYEYVIYTGANLTVFCQVSRYYFSFGHRFGFEYENGTILYTPSIDGDLDDVRNVNRMSVTVPVESELKRVYCFAPVWNSTKWVNQSMEFIVRDDGTAPTVKITDNTDNEIDGKNPSPSVTFPLHESNVTLSCRGEGTPVPDITWLKDDLPLKHSQGSQIEVEPGRKDLIFPYVTYSIKGKYTCKVRNSLGVASKVIQVGVRDEFALLVQLSGVGLMILISGFVVILVLCWKKIQRQRRQLRALTDSEIKEFRDGNLEVLEGSEFLDTQELLHALPYNDEFEIPCERLYIDMSNILGTGNFGQVVKGSISSRINNRRTDMVVAVKTVKPNHDVAYFKTLLSEVKIMAYIGHHPNLVSLVGACTGNIRKREIFIAVEYCSKGSLEKFLKNCRPSFVNLICNDSIHITSSFIDNKEDIHSSAEIIQTESDIIELGSDSCTTTAHLLKWSREIANGMEFLGSKKIIHGDLASRNVLLNESLVAKIGDFGLSRQLMEYKNYVRSTDDDCLLPWKWMAIETLEDMKFSVQSDAWSYGVTLWEIFTLGNLPYPGINWNFRFLDELKNGMRLHKPTYAHSQIYNVMLDCWSLDTCERPTFTELKDFFEGLLLQTCNDEYLETKYLQNGKTYVNGCTNVHVNNPGYCTLGNDEISKANGEYIEESKTNNAKLINGNRSKIATTTISTIDGQGYLRPLMLESQDVEEEC